MRAADDTDRKAPRGPDRGFKGAGVREGAEATPWNEVRPHKRSADDDRHVHL